jgi:ABC-type nitrate/sulfonate/bicarbonate transport system permease component
MLVAFYWGLRSRAGIWVALLGMIGQVSLINTFYHLHTPLLISLQRAAGGLILGAALGVVLILGLKIIFGIVIGREGSPPRRG